MTNAELLIKIKAEIESWLREYAEDSQFELGESYGYKRLLTFLSTLESEKPIQDGLEEEIQRFLSNATKMDKGEWKGKYPISEMGFGVVARHFDQWGAEQQKEQMMKEAVEAKFISMDEGIIKYSPLFTRKLKQIFRPSDKVRIIIVKED